MSNWDYATDVPTYTWRSSMTIARSLKLKKADNKYLLVSQPIKELNKYKKTILQKDNIHFKESYSRIIEKEIEINKSVIEVKLSNLVNDVYTFSLSNNEGDSLEFGINNIENYYFIDRQKSGNTNFSEKFTNVISKASFDNPLNEINIQLIIDKPSIALFYNHGETVMTEIFFPKSPMHSLKIVSKNNSETIIDKLAVSELEFNN